MSNENHPLRQLFGLMPDIKRPEWREPGYFDGLNDTLGTHEQNIEYFNRTLDRAINPKAKARILRQIIILSYANIIKKHCV